jgi:hypothetical protein
VRIDAGPDRVRVALEPGTFSRRVAVAVTRPVQATDGERATALAGALDAALAELSIEAPLDGTAAVAEVDDEWALFDVASGDFSANAPDELGRIAQACADELLGAEAAAWLVRWQLQPSEHHLLIGMLPTDVCAAIEETALAHRLALRGLQPRFCGTWNRCAPGVAGDCAVFVATSAHQALVACVERRAISALGTGPWSALDAARPGPAGRTLALASLDAMVDRLATSHGIDLAAVSEYRLAVADPSVWKSPGRWTVVEAGGLA